jgi:hypothetical protein
VDNSITVPNGVFQFVNCSVMVFMDELSIFFNIFCVLLESGSPERSSSSTDILPAFKRECYSKTDVLLNECFPKASHQGFR